ncbi:hypothetical protein AB4525_14795 [Vibrio breoganii]|uniref:hypothetical protein n=1 Tax=Vibrio breoganii TaxID=553239 RepID=UPI000C82C328|nr:hypothetical protein [Vibrio breoganii]
MFSQSLTAQLVRWTLALSVSLLALHNCQPMLDVLAEQAMAAGCHQHDSIEGHMHAAEHQQHKHHH